MRGLINFFDANMVEGMAIVSAILLIYALLRQFRTHPAIAACFAASPVIAIWTFQNVLAGRIGLPII